jgi:hypothetical protein
MTIPYRVRAKLFDNEFDAEGPEEVVKADYQLFVETVERLRVAPAPPNPLKPPPVGNGGETHDSEIEPAVLQRIFRVDGDQVTLRVLPQSQQREADGVLLLLYGFRVMAQQQDVLSSRLLVAAQTSGLNVERIDRALVPYMELVNKGGIKAGSRWGLRNTGITRAEEIVRTAMS